MDGNIIPNRLTGASYIVKENYVLSLAISKVWTQIAYLRLEWRTENVAEEPTRRHFSLQEL